MGATARMGVCISLLAISVLLISIVYRNQYDRRSDFVPADTTGLHLFLPITKGTLNYPRSASWFCKTLLSALVNNYEPILYNWDSQLTGKDSHKLKVLGLVERLHDQKHGIEDGDIVVMADALDVWFQLPPEDLIDRYRSYDKPVIVGAELQCWPNDPACLEAPPGDLPANLFEDAVVDESLNGLPRHANSGFVVGTLVSMKSFYKDLEAILMDPSYRHKQSDQGAFQTALAQGKVAVDHRLRLVWNSAFDADAILYINHPRHPDGRNDTLNHRTTPWHLYPPLGKHLWTGETPVALHYNGPIVKNELVELWSEVWYGSDKRGFQDIVRERLHGKTVRVVQGGVITHLTANELCAAHLSAFAEADVHPPVDTT